MDKNILDDLTTLENRAFDKQQSIDQNGWADPQPIPDPLLPVATFDYDLLPEQLRAWVQDIAARMQCPPDFVAVAAITAISSLIGRKAALRPKRQDDWIVIPNLWCMVVGRPGVMKSPAVNEAIKPLNRLAVDAQKIFTQALDEFECKSKMSELLKKNAEKKAQKLLSQGRLAEAELELINSRQSEEMPPQLKRYIVNDSTVEALGQILIENPLGTLVYRDEIHGLLCSLDKEGQEGARAFYLQGYDGNQGYTFDRIMRGAYLHIPAVCVSLLGNIQPGKIQAYVKDAVSGGAGDDGLLQRFGLLVWPDLNSSWTNIDRYPDSVAKTIAFDVFARLDNLVPTIDDQGQESPVIYVFSADAQDMFDEWRHEFENNLRNSERHPALESHFSKYRKLIPALALVCALVDGETKVSAISLSQALAWAEYLQTHAERTYNAGIQSHSFTAQAILAKIKSGKLKGAFKTGDISQKGWSSLTNTKEINLALQMLVDLDYLAKLETFPGAAGGRPSCSFLINPKVRNG